MTSPPRRNWHFTRWLIIAIVGIIATLGWREWRADTFRTALARAKALGWYVESEYTDPVGTIRRNWVAAFRKETWGNGVRFIHVDTSEAFEQNLDSVHRLNPKRLDIYNAATLPDLSALKPLTRLQHIQLHRCTGLTNVDGLKNLSALQQVQLYGCTGLKKESVAELKAALPNAQISGP